MFFYSAVQMAEPPGRKERGNMGCQGRVPYFKPLPLPGNKCASLQNNDYKAWERIQGTQNPSVGIGALAEALLWLASCGPGGVGAVGPA